MNLAPLALLLLAAQEPARPLLSPPEGWAGEHLAFPLGFAPDIALEGFEELAFAPGMFAPESDSYFSYALALALEGEPRVDRAFVRDFLERYYVGLCRAVAEGRGLELPLDEITVAVARTDAGFRAEIAMFDAFVTGEPLDLVLELEVHPAVGRTEVLGLASPLDADAPVWDELHAIGARWRAARPAALLLNHAFFVVDRATFDALLAAELPRELALAEVRDTVRADTTYTGLYLYGRDTYFEFVPEGTGGMPAGTTGLALGLERAGASAALAGTLGEAGLRTQVVPITRALDERQVPWFTLVGVEMPSAPLSVFAMEYDPRFLASWHGAGEGISRAAVLERYADVLAPGEAPRPFLDVRMLELALDGPQRERILTVARAAGHTVEERDGRWAVHAPGFRMDLRPSEAPGGITALELELRAEVEREPVTIGTTTWTFDGRRVRLTVE